MSEEEERKSSWFRSLCCRIVRTGHIPRHVAIIMDGNRRFAKKMKYSEVFHGHVSGFNKFMETLEWCLDLGILEVTVYVFSIENFKRSKEEVDGLMELAKQRLAELLVKRLAVSVVLNKVTQMFVKKVTGKECRDNCVAIPSIEVNTLAKRTIHSMPN